MRALGFSIAALCLIAPSLLRGQTQTESGKITADDGQPGDEFGTSVAIGGDAIIVGVPLDDDVGTDSGSVYLFERTGDAWAQATKLTETDGTSYRYFGIAVAIDGDVAIAGSPLDTGQVSRSGTATVIERVDGVWMIIEKLAASDGARRDEFGIAVSVSGRFAVVGAHRDNDLGAASGSAYVFERLSDGWVQRAKLTASDGSAGDEFGYRVAIHGDLIAVGSPGDDDHGDWSGSAYIYQRISDEWIEQVKLVPADGAMGDRFGEAVDIDGETALVGATYDDAQGSSSGSAYIFKRQDGIWTQHAKLYSFDGHQYEYDRFGSAVSIFEDTAVIGAPEANERGSRYGAAYVFRRIEGEWVPAVRLIASDREPGDTLGLDVAVHGDTAIAGSKYDDEDGDFSGSVYLYDTGLPCRVDLNEDGVVDSRDFIRFLGAWSSGDPLADWDGNDLIDTRDFLAYLTDWVAGC